MSRIHVEVALALPERQVVKALDVPAGCTARAAVKLSGIADDFPELILADLALGIYSKTVPDEHVLVEGDRVELYRPLLLDPREARQQRAAQRRQKTPGP